MTPRVTGPPPALAWLDEARIVLDRLITRASVVGTERSQALFDEAYREHARRLARAIIQQGNAAPEQQEV